MHHKIDVVKQNPAPLREALGVVRDDTILLELLLDALGERPDVRVRGPAGYDEEVRHFGHALEVEDEYVGSFVVGAHGGGALD